MDTRAVLDQNQIDRMELLLFARAIFFATASAQSGGTVQVRINGQSCRATMRLHAQHDRSRPDELRKGFVKVEVLEESVERPPWSPMGIAANVNMQPELDKAEHHLRQLVHSFIDRIVVDASDVGTWNRE